MTYTTISSENDAVQISASLVEKKYYNPHITFYRIKGDWRDVHDDEVAEIWDNSTYLIDELYVNIVKLSNLGMCISNFDIELKALLENAKCSLDELKSMITQSIELGFFENVECEFFS